MWIQTTNTDSAGNPVTRSIRVPGIDDPVEFSASGKAQVTSEVGERLVAAVDTIVRVETNDDSDDSDSDSDSDSDTD